MDPTILPVVPHQLKLRFPSLLVNVPLIVRRRETLHLFVALCRHHHHPMTDPAVMIHEAVAARAVNILTENFQTGKETGSAIETGIGKGKGKGKGIGIGIGTEIRTEKGTGKGKGIGTGRGTERESGTENGSVIENQATIMIVDPDIQKEKGEAVVMVAGIIAAEAEAQARAGVKLYKPVSHLVLPRQETETRRRPRR